MQVKGKVKSGLGNASFWVDKIQSVFEQKYDMKLFLGTLNIELEKEYILDEKEKILASEYGGELDVFIKECEILGSKGYIVRPARNNQKGGDHALNIIEIVSDINFRKTHDLKDDDEITLFI